MTESSRPSPSASGGPGGPPDPIVGGEVPAFAEGRTGGIALETGELHRLLVEHVQDYAIFALDPRGFILSWNAGAERLKGYTADEIIGRHFSIFYPQAKIEERFPEYELEVASQVGRFEDEGWRIRKDGSRFWANVVITALRDEAGQLVGFAKVTRDLTERRAAEEKLRQSEERFRLLVQGVRDYAIFMLDPAGYVATWNEGAERIKGYTAAEAIGRHFSIFLPPEEVAAGKPARELEIARREGEYEEEGWRLRKDGTRFWAGVVLSPLHDEAGQLVGFAKVTRDLTERRAAEEQALANARRVAAEEAARYAAELRERETRGLVERLRVQAAELEAANHAKAQFLASMSHELRTPLNAIGGYVELLSMGLRGPVTEEQQADLARVRRSQQHLLGIINDILNFSRIEAGQVEYDLGPIALADVVDSVAQMIAPQAEQKGLRLEAADCPPELVAWADRAKVEQVLLNLLSNAVKFTAPGGTVAVSCEARDALVALTVRDTGSGIPAEQLQAIFEPFVQVGRTLSSPNEGTGLGLAISRDLARAMGGDVSAVSTLGEGSAFTLTLPRPPER